MQADTAQRTLLLVKHDGVQRGLIGNITSRFENRGFKIVAAKLVKPTLTQAKSHYSEHDGKNFFADICNSLSEGPVFALVVEGENVIQTSRLMIGSTNPGVSAPGTIRADFACCTKRNVIHGSDSEASYKNEVVVWFKDEEIIDWNSDMQKWSHPAINKNANESTTQ